MDKRRIAPLAALACFAFVGSALGAPAPARPAGWAVAVEAKGVTNFYRVEPDLYRSARPSPEGYRELAALGVKTILDVESAGDDGVAAGTSIRLFHVPMSAFGLRDDRVLEAMRILADPANRPIVIHCHHGADRTGAMMALYRVVVEGWSKDDALREMNEGGYHHSSLWENLDRYVRTANIDALRKELKIANPAATLAAALAITPSRAAGPDVRVAGGAPDPGSSVSSAAAPAGPRVGTADSRTAPVPTAVSGTPAVPRASSSLPAAAAGADRH